LTEGEKREKKALAVEVVKGAGVELIKSIGVGEGAFCSR
jgi:hypothetical protein